jgi:hypothetical protein
MSGPNHNSGGNFSFSPNISEVKGELQGTSPQERLDLLESKLPDLSEINANEPGEGYRNFALLSEVYSKNKLENELLNSASKVIHFEYVYETTDIVKNIHEGELVDVETLTAHIVDIYWVGNIILFAGSSEDAAKARNRLQSELVGELRIQKVSFSTDILNKILEDKYGERVLNEKDPKITDIRSLTAQGKENVSQLSIHGGKGLPTYKKYLEDASRVTQMIANFNYLNYSILASISESNIHIYTISPDDNIGNDEKLLISILFSVSFIQDFYESNQRLIK